jgi:hypothetical protein
LEIEGASEVSPPSMMLTRSTINFTAKHSKEFANHRVTGRRKGLQTLVFAQCSCTQIADRRHCLVLMDLLRHTIRLPPKIPLLPNDLHSTHSVRPRIRDECTVIRWNNYPGLIRASWPAYCNVVVCYSVAHYNVACPGAHGCL